MLPLLREERGSGTSTVEKRVIGAGLQALEKNEDGPAVKKLFYAFAVTQVSGLSAVTFGHSYTSSNKRFCAGGLCASDGSC